MRTHCPGLGWAGACWPPGTLAEAASPHPSLLLPLSVGLAAAPAPHTPSRQPTSTHSFPGVAISTYAKYCYHKLQKAALTGAKKVHVSPGTARQGGEAGPPGSLHMGPITARVWKVLERVHWDGQPGLHPWVQNRCKRRGVWLGRGLRPPVFVRVAATPAAPGLPPSGWCGWVRGQAEGLPLPNGTSPGRWVQGTVPLLGSHQATRQPWRSESPDSSQAPAKEGPHPTER